MDKAHITFNPGDRLFAKNVLSFSQWICPFGRYDPRRWMSIKSVDGENVVYDTFIIDQVLGEIKLSRNSRGKLRHFMADIEAGYLARS